jgi:acylphosphatase
MSEATSIHVTISGRVQGVGYRAWLHARASALGLSGWVRNRRDGTVEAMIHGPSETVARLLAECRNGPRAARVDGIEYAETVDATPAATFEVRPTL